MNVKILDFLDKMASHQGKSLFELEKFFVNRNLKKHLKNKNSKYEFCLIAGCPRSGTTLLEALLSAHPKIKSPLTEIDFSSKRNFSKAIKRSLGCEIKRGDLEKTFKKFANKKYLILKRPVAIFYLDTLFRYFPQMKVIHIIRDGRDVVMSLNKSKHFGWPVQLGCRAWKRSIVLGKRYRNNQKYYEVRYENLVKEPVKTINKILKFLGKKRMKKERVLNHYKYIKNKKSLPVRGAGKPLYTSSIGKWKNEMIEEDKKTFKKIAGKTLIELGYEKDNHW